MTFNDHYLTARKQVRVTKRGPGSYAAIHRSLRVRAQAKHREQALMICAMRAAQRMLTEKQ